MREGEWNLWYSANGVHPGANLTFGSFDTGMYLIKPHEMAYTDLRTGEVEMPLEDGYRLGQDWQARGVITLEIGVDAVDDAPDRIGRHGAVVDKMGLLRQAWRGDAVRRRFATPALLRTRQGGRERRVYGRPRKFAPAASDLTRQGYTPAVAEFEMVDDLVYDEKEQAITVDLVPPLHRGIAGPLKDPLTMVGEGSTRVPGQILVAGTVPAWPVITFYGPISNPACRLLNQNQDPDEPGPGTTWEVGVNLSLSEGQSVRIDPRPWRRLVTRGSANVAGSLTRSSPKLKDLRLPLGYQDLQLRGKDATGTAYMTVAWRDAYTSI